MRKKIYLCLLSLMIIGCGTTIELESFEDGRNNIDENTAIVQLRSGTEYKGRDVKVRRDTIQLIDMETKNIIRISNKEIKSIKTTNHALGSLEGFAIGAGSLGLTTAILLYSSDEGGEKSEHFKDNVYPYFTIIGAGIGGLLGSVFGGFIGHHYTYVFPIDSVNNGLEILSDSTNNSNQQIIKTAP